MSSHHPNILSPDSTLIVLVDLQAPFLDGVEERARVVERCQFLAQAAAVLGVRILTTVQYQERMGGLVPEIVEVAPDIAPLDKMCFSCARSDQFLETLRADGARQILIAGVETHICVAQTALDLVHHGYQVHVAADAVSSRGMDRHKLGMEKMRDAGVIPCSAEQAVFELMQRSGTPEFKQILKLVKSQ